MILLVGLALGKELVFVQTLIRHGSRFPIFPSPDVPDLRSDFGELTPTGMRQHFLLGRMYSQRYAALLPEKFNHSDVYVRSSSTNRTIESALSFLAGFYYQKGPALDPKLVAMSVPPWTGAVIPDISTALPQGYQPIWVENWVSQASSQYQGDFLTQFTNPTCPQQQFWRADNTKSEQYVRVSSSLQKALQTVWQQTKAGGSVDLYRGYQLLDDQICRKYLGQSYIPFLDSNRSEVEQITLQGIILTYFGTLKQRRVVSTPLLNHTLDNLAKLGKSGPKFILYSAHDNTILTLLTALNLTTSECINASYHGQPQPNCVTRYPTYASHFTFELWKDADNYTVQALYQGKAVKLQFCSAIECSLQEFRAGIKSVIVQDYLAQCGLTESSHLWVLQLILGVLILAAGAGALLLLRRYRKASGALTLIEQKEGL